jgi:L-aspartate oxidase
MKHEADIVIVGAGAAGLIAALTLAPRRVVVLSEGPCASGWAQGGFAAAVGADDTAQSHAEDTLKTAAGTADAGTACLLTAEAPRHVQLLEQYGVRFERDAEGSFKLSREACHARRRVLKAKAGDGFGAELMRALNAAAHDTPSIHLVENASAERLIVQNGAVCGVQIRKDGKSTALAASAVLLATGGIGGLYAATTNPLTATGRGLALAARAGAALSDLEFVQFHPTALDTGEDPAPLASEALRGEGARLVNSRGERFIDELAPRDVATRAIFAQMRRGQKVYMDCRAFDVSRFPALVAACVRANINAQKDLIPVTPAAHYHMGGVATDLNGRSSVKGLWAAGEVASTGLHGANRLASNSLMEAVIMGARAGRDMKEAVSEKIKAETVSLPAADMEHDTLRHAMSDLVGVVRDARGLKEAVRRIYAIEHAAEKTDAKTADMALVARMIAVSALQRTESRGGHCRSDFPETLRRWQKRSFTTLKEIDALTADILAPVREAV